MFREFKNIFSNKLFLIYLESCLFSFISLILFYVIDTFILKFAKQDGYNFWLLNIIASFGINLIIIIGIKFVYLKDKSLVINKIPVEVMSFFLWLLALNLILDGFSNSLSLESLSVRLGLFVSFGLVNYLVLKRNLPNLEIYSHSLETKQIVDK